jgi:long-subunit fatty acid transport protein
MKIHSKKIVLALFGCFTFSNLYASDFNVPFVSASGLGNLYADWATNIDDSSNSFTNPAGLTQLHHQHSPDPLLRHQRRLLKPVVHPVAWVH